MTQTPENTPQRHVFRGLLQKPQIWTLDGETLHWQAGSQHGQLALADISSLRIHVQGHGESQAWFCVLEDSAGRKYKISNRQWNKAGHLFPRNLNNTPSFLALIFPLAGRLKQINPKALISEGPSHFEWVANCIVAALAMAMVIGGVGLMMAQGKVHYHLAAFMGMAVIYLPLMWPVIRSRGPKPLDPDTLPDISRQGAAPNEQA